MSVTLKNKAANGGEREEKGAAILFTSPFFSSPSVYMFMKDHECLISILTTTTHIPTAVIFLFLDYLEVLFLQPHACTAPQIDSIISCWGHFIKTNGFFEVLSGIPFPSFSCLTTYNMWMCTCLHFVCLQRRHLPSLHVNFIIGKQRGAMVGEREREEEREAKKERWKQRGVFCCREEGRTIPACGFHDNSDITVRVLPPELFEFLYWVFAIKRTDRSVRVYVRKCGHGCMCEPFLKEIKPLLQSLCGYPLLPGNGSHGNKLKHVVALLSETRRWGGLLALRYKWV